jgi:hypothetical protein
MGLLGVSGKKQLIFAPFLAKLRQTEMSEIYG